MDYVEKLTTRAIIINTMPKKKTKDKFFEGYKPFKYFDYNNKGTSNIDPHKINPKAL